MLWGGERLKSRIKELIVPPDEDRIDGAGYRLSVGEQVYVSPTGEPSDPPNKPRTRLSEGECFTIPPGQFGFILTEEVVRVPMEAMALISIRTRYKFRGLVNVSGFHVDPNYHGRILFAIFNAGPVAVHLSRGEQCFLIWYADLDQPKNVKVKKGYDEIPSEYTGPLAGGLESFARLSSRINALEREQALIKWASALALGALIALGVRSCTSPGPETSRKVERHQSTMLASNHRQNEPLRLAGFTFHPDGPAK